MDVSVNASVFPHPDQIPQQVRLAGSIEQREYLCDGVLRRWEGPLQDVESPVCLQNGSRLDRKRIGAYPLLTGREALDVLAADTRAWNQGRGVWPDDAKASREIIKAIVTNRSSTFLSTDFIL